MRVENKEGAASSPAGRRRDVVRNKLHGEGDRSDRSDGLQKVNPAAPLPVERQMFTFGRLLRPVSPAKAETWE